MIPSSRHGCRSLSTGGLHLRNLFREASHEGCRSLSNAGLPGLTRDAKLRSPLIFSGSIANGSMGAPYGPYVYKWLGYRRVVLTGLGYWAGRDKVGAFAQRLQAAGVKSSAKLCAPVATPDLGSYL